LEGEDSYLGWDTIQGRYLQACQRITMLSLSGSSSPRRTTEPADEAL